MQETSRQGAAKPVQKTKNKAKTVSARQDETALANKRGKYDQIFI